MHAANSDFSMPWRLLGATKDIFSPGSTCESGVLRFLVADIGGLATFAGRSLPAAAWTGAFPSALFLFAG